MGKLASFFQRFTRQDDNTLAMQDMARKMRQVTKQAQRAAMHKPIFSMGFRGYPRVLNVGHIPAPTLDQVRSLERAYLCKLTVKHGLIYFRGTDIAFTHDRGKEHRHALMQEKLDECAA